MSQTIEIGKLTDIPKLGSRVVKTNQGDIAIFRTEEDQVFAMHDKCPHKQGALSQGIVHNNTVTCPLHNWVIGLNDGEAQGHDKGCVKTFEARLEGDNVILVLDK